MNRTFACLLAATAVFIAACPFVRAQNLVSNPSFEAGTFINGVGGYDKYMILNPGDSNITSWGRHQ